MLTRGLLSGSLFVAAALVAAAASSASQPRPAASTLTANAIDHAIEVDGAIEDWAGVPGIRVALSGEGGADEVALRAAIHGDRIYMLAIWDDADKDDLHKPYQWNDASQSYKKTDRMEDRFALSLPMSGDFSPNKIDGSEFTADVWHWKAHRSNPVGLAHDKWWRVSKSPFEGSRAFETEHGGTVHLQRPSDAGDRLYKVVRYYVKEADIMPLYELDGAARGSIADVQATGVWRDGRWYLELSRLLDTGHDDDAVIPANGTMPFAIALFDGISKNIVDGGAHSVSDLLLLETRAASS